MKIISATYGGVDCTAQIQSRVNGNTISVRSNNDIIGDPSSGNHKLLIITLEDENGESTHHIDEGNVFVYPETPHDRLGVFYSNNNIHSIYPAIRASLASIKKASEGKADIVTCMWYHEQENPFIEYLSWSKNTSHLNQLLQVLQALYSARENKDYKYVSFLEHDVMYPEGYFDYPEINPGEVYTNMNYIGINKDGFQNVPTKHEPFHQMTMLFDEAIAHCEGLLSNALVTNSGLIEPQVPLVERKQWNCINPAVHINHGQHFTSHFSIYSSTDIYQDDPYWGNHSQYLKLL
jgi:hypothetical protein